MNKFAQQQTVMQDPLKLGIQLGVAGAAAGLGVAAIHRAIRLKHGNQTPVSVVKPMLAGALIGTVLGAATTSLGQRQSKYASLRTALEKQALFDSYSNWNEKHPWLSSAGYMLPGVGAAMSAADSGKAFSEGRWMAGLGNALMIPATAIGLGGVMKAIPRMAGIARASRGVAGAVHPGRIALAPGAGRFARLGRNAQELWQGTAAQAFGKPLSQMSINRTGQWAARGQKLENAMGINKKVLGMSVPTAGLVGGLGLTVGDGIMDSRRQQQEPLRGSRGLHDLHGGVTNPNMRSMAFAAGQPQQRSTYKRMQDIVDDYRSFNGY